MSTHKQKNLTLYDFGVTTSYQHHHQLQLPQHQQQHHQQQQLKPNYLPSNLPHETSTICDAYLKIRDVGHQSESTICGGRSRERLIHQSESGRVEITFLYSEKGKDNDDDDGDDDDDDDDGRNNGHVRFMLKYEAVGCVDPLLNNPLLTMLRRESRTAVISCNFTNQATHPPSYQPSERSHDHFRNDLNPNGFNTKIRIWIQIPRISNFRICGIPIVITVLPNALEHSRRVLQHYIVFMLCSIDMFAKIYEGLFVAVIIGLFLGLLIGFLMLAVIVACNRRHNMKRSEMSVGTGKMDGRSKDDEGMKYEVRVLRCDQALVNDPDYNCNLGNIINNNNGDNSKNVSSNNDKKNQFIGCKYDTITAQPQLLDITNFDLNQQLLQPNVVLYDAQYTSQHQQQNTKQPFHQGYQQLQQQQLQQQQLQQQQLQQHLPKDDDTNQFINFTTLTRKQMKNSFEMLNNFSNIHQSSESFQHAPRRSPHNISNGSRHNNNRRNLMDCTKNLHAITSAAVESDKLFDLIFNNFCLLNSFHYIPV
ncbi:hypothetical protein HELRODRAFT_165998 [Helobdella robusta]|uniref:Uncharacterized protein n=1 Tax=Helobdella robusta TaxID=6412 RepID=T1EXK0_HELRO|nr:hypothetical protein HELRODRAFT_165998 [Helobdella robusta]ESN90340.1 hypothetical protein HELRODRAFT_165998 [Helobdella robusta]